MPDLKGPSTHFLSMIETISRRAGAKLWALLILGCLCGCSPTPLQGASPSQTASPAPTGTSTAPATARPTHTAPPTPAVAPTELTRSTSSPRVCSPLADVPRAALEDTVSNPYHPPETGSDDPHQGVDFSDVSPTGRIALEGRAVQAVLTGTVSIVIADRFPYGHGVILETPLADLPRAWTQALGLPDPIPEREGHPSLTCPPAGKPLTGRATDRSLYSLYAHLQAPAELEPGQSVPCGAVLGAIGASGNALNPHLHLEVRVGPAGARFPGLAHYDSRATVEEMAGYCLWRVSGRFQSIDPLRLFLTAP